MLLSLLLRASPAELLTATDATTLLAATMSCCDRATGDESPLRDRWRIDVNRDTAGWAVVISETFTHSYHYYNYYNNNYYYYYYYRQRTSHHYEISDGLTLNMTLRDDLLMTYLQHSHHVSWLLLQCVSKQESPANAKASVRQPWYIGCNSRNRPPLRIAQQYQRNLYFQCSTIPLLTMRVYLHWLSRCCLSTIKHAN